jgi:hypothetical protein
MKHRHLNHQDFSLATVDDVIARGLLYDWLELRRTVLADRTLLIMHRLQARAAHGQVA